jgi:hypothetical protein
VLIIYPIPQIVAAAQFFPWPDQIPLPSVGYAQEGERGYPSAIIMVGYGVVVDVLGVVVSVDVLPG